MNCAPLLTKERCAYAVLVLLLVVHAVGILNPYLGFDESGQFFISRGLNHYSLPYAPASGLADVVYSNAYYNLDPGGFSVLLYVWSLFSNASYWLRILPFLFFVGYVILVERILKRITHDGFFSLLACGVIVTVHTSMPTNLRPYSMEMFFTVLVCYLTLLIKLKKALWFYWTIGICSAIAISSRYSILPTVSLFIATFLFRMYREHLLSWSRITSLLLLVFIVGICILMFSLQHQMGKNTINSNYNELYISTNPKRLLTWWWIPVGLSIFYLWRNRKKEKRDDSLVRLTWVFLLMNCFFILTSILQLHPWGMKKCGSLNALMPIQLFLMLWYFLNRWKYLKSLMIITLTVCSVVLIVSVKYPKHWDQKEYTFSDFFSFEPAEGKVFVGQFSESRVRYLFEYGCLQSQQRAYGYPSLFYFQSAVPHVTTNYFAEVEKLYFSKDKQGADACSTFVDVEQYIIDDQHLKRLEADVYVRE